jgi:abhydrolase domain-containing protein 17
VMNWKKLLIGEFSFKRMIISLITIPLLLYVGFGIYAYFFADSLIFQPQPQLIKDDNSVFKITTPNGEKISAKFFKNETATFTILYSHGNAEDINELSPFFEQLSKAGFNVLAYEYGGYGSSDGKPSEKNSYEDIETAYNYLITEQRISPQKIIIHGRSLGGAISIDLALRKKCGGLIVESSFVSSFRVVTKIAVYPFDRFDSISKIDRVNCPKLFIHGRTDALIPIWHGEKLYSEVNEPKTFFAVEDAGHNDLVLIAGKSYFESILKFSATISE